MKDTLDEIEGNLIDHVRSLVKDARVILLKPKQYEKINVIYS